MGVILGLVLVSFFVYGLVFVIIHTAGAIQRKMDRTITELTAERNEAEKQVAIAEKGLRLIANNISGNPVLDAQDALDSISNVKAIG